MEDLFRFNDENVAAQLKTAPFALGYYTLRFYTENGKPVNKVTNDVEEFYLYPSGGTLRDSSFNIVFCDSQYDNWWGFKRPD